MKTPHWLGIILLCAFFLLVATFAAAGIAYHSSYKGAYDGTRQAIDDYIDTNGYEEVNKAF